VLAAGLQHRHDAQVGVGEEPFSGFRAGRAGGASQGAKVLVLRKAAKVLKADTREFGNFLFSEEPLAGLDANHGYASLVLRLCHEIIFRTGFLQ
jgi:hypothetical protein